MRRIYLDHNATTPLDPAVMEEISRVEREFPANPESAHQSGRAARSRLEDAREAVALALGAEPTEILFTSGGTESDNLALRGALRAAPPGRRHLVVSAIEHPAVRKTAHALEEEGFSVTVIPPDPVGLISVEEFGRSLRPDTALASVMAANHETGTIQPIRELALLARARGVLFHTDAVQAVGRIPTSFADLGVDLLSVSAHKVGGPKGIGALCRRGSARLLPILTGGEQEGALRAGTPSVSLCAGLALALEIAIEELEIRTDQWNHLSGLLLDGLKASLEGIHVNGSLDERLPNTLNLSFDGVSGSALVMALDLAGVEVSTGSACASGAALPSPVLTAMGFARERVDGAIRLSMGRATSEADVGRILEVLPPRVRQLRR